MRFKQPDLQEKLRASVRAARVHMLTKELRHETCAEPTIPAGSVRGISSALKEMGLEPGQVFFKASSRRAYDVLKGCIPSTYAVQTEAAARAEYVQQKRIAQVLPENAAAPLAILTDQVHRKKMVGYFMQFVDGQTIKEYLASPRIGQDPGAERIMQEITRVMQRLDAFGVGHGDITPNNVMVSDGGRVVLIDPLPVAFRLAKLFSSRRDFVRSNPEMLKIDARYLASLRSSLSACADTRRQEDGPRKIEFQYV